MTAGDLLVAAARAGLAERIDALGDALQRGVPDLSRVELERVAADLTAAGIEEPGLVDALREAAIQARLQRPDYGAVMATIDGRLAEDDTPAERWADQPEGLMYLQSLAAALVPLAGLDMEAARAGADTFLANFPSVSLPFGDVDERAANWLARLHDSPAVRASLRGLLVRVADAWAVSAPLAAEQVRRWAAGAAPDDPTADVPWMRALVALVRAQL